MKARYKELHPTVFWIRFMMTTIGEVKLLFNYLLDIGFQHWWKLTAGAAMI